MRMSHKPRLLNLPPDEKFHLMQMDFFIAKAIVQLANAVARLILNAD